MFLQKFNHLGQVLHNLFSNGIISSHGKWKVHERILVILADQPGPNGQLFCLHSFKKNYPMKPTYTLNEMI